VPRYLFNYTECPIDPSPAFPGGFVTRRPLLQVTLTNGLSRLSCYAIVDSGADYTLFPKSHMSQLGINSQAALIGNTAGVGSQPDTLFHEVGMDIEGRAQFSVYAGFTSALESLGVGLLGQNGFFDHLSVSLNFRQGTFEIET
jgi:hypothetical protein